MTLFKWMFWSCSVCLVGCNSRTTSPVTNSCTSSTIQTVQIEVCERNCKAGSARACGTAAKKYSGGIGVKKNLKKGLELGLHGCELGDAAGCDVAGLIYSGIYDANFENQAALQPLAYRELDLLEHDCSANEGDACETLSTWYEKDWSVPIRIEGNPEKAAALARQAIHLYQQACDDGDGYACNKLAGKYASGKLAGVDRTEELIQRACELGYAASCSLAGAGDLGPKGGALLRRGCDLGDSSSCTMLASTLRVRGEVEEAAQLEVRACELRDEMACKKLGNLLRANPAAAHRAFQKACELGDAESCSL